MTAVVKEKITEYLKAERLSIAELERRAGLSIHSVRNILKGRIKKPSAQSLQAIAEALNCSLAELMSPDNLPSSQKKEKNSPPIDYPDLMLDCTKVVLSLITASSSRPSVDEYLDVVRKVYAYSSKGEPRTVDLKFAEWLIETQLR